MNTCELHCQGIRTAIADMGSGKPLIFLHGWGSDSNAFAGMLTGLAEKGHGRCIAIDLPGFGKSAPPPQPWCSVEYADWLEELLEILGVQSPVLLGHSFGGKVAAQLAARGKASRIILFGSAGIPPQRPLSYYLRVYGYKLIKGLAKVPLFGPLFGDIRERMAGRGGSADYRAAQGVMRASLVRSVNEDLRPIFSKISCPTLLIWGKNDTATPLIDGETIHRLIPDSALIPIEQAGHYVFVDRPTDCLRIVESFVGEDHA